MLTLMLLYLNMVLIIKNKKYLFIYNLIGRKEDLIMEQLEIIIDRSNPVITEKDSLAIFDLFKNFINSISNNMDLIVEPEKKDGKKPYIHIFDNLNGYYIEWSINGFEPPYQQYSLIVCNRRFYKKGVQTIQQTPVTLLSKHVKELFRYANEYKGIRHMLN